MGAAGGTPMNFLAALAAAKAGSRIALASWAQDQPKRFLAYVEGQARLVEADEAPYQFRIADLEAEWVVWEEPAPAMPMFAKLGTYFDTVAQALVPPPEGGQNVTCRRVLSVALNGDYVVIGYE
jgi:hypothetical protein